MATGDSNSRKDIAWKYAYLADPNKKNDLTCNFCGKVAKGGAYRLKQHLAGNSKAITSCQKCPERVKEEVQQYMLKKKEGKKQEENEVAEVNAPDKRGQNVATPNDAHKEELREKACVDIATWMYEKDISFDAVDSDSFIVAIQSIGRCGIGMKPPSRDELRSLKRVKPTEQPLSPKDAMIVPVNPSPDAVLIGPSRDVTKQKESTEAVTFHPLNANVSHQQNLLYGDVQYSPVATPQINSQLYPQQEVPFSPSYYARAPAPNMPHMSSAIPISQAGLMLPENGSIDTLPSGQGSGYVGFGSFGGGNISENLGSSYLTSTVTYQPMGIHGSYEHNAAQVNYNDNPSAVLSYYYDFNPQMVYEPRKMLSDCPLDSPQVTHSPPYNAQAFAPNSLQRSNFVEASAPNLPQNSSANWMVPKNSSIDTMHYGPASGDEGFGSFYGEDLSSHECSSPPMPPVLPQTCMVDEFAMPICDEIVQIQRPTHGCYRKLSSNSKPSPTFGDASISYPVVNDRNRLTLVEGRRRERDRDSISIFDDPQVIYNVCNRGPRASKLRSKSGTEQGSSSVSKYVISTLGIPLDSYNRLDFVTDYENAKFFIIKSLSEDNVHKSIKYNVWASTPHGNKKLDAAYHEAKEVKGYCPVFLLFSVKETEQFCGVAEMVGPVDFEKDADYWQQDRWSGQFSVRWYIIKDVPKTRLRHIRLESNDNKPVTHSRDSQEVALKEGIEMLKIFKDYDTRTSILDDFEYYDERERDLRERKARQIASSTADVSDSPADESVNQMSDSFAQALKLDERNNKEVPATEQGGSSRSDAPLSLSHDSVNQTSDSLSDSFNRVMRLEESNNEVLASEKGGGHKN